MPLSKHLIGPGFGIELQGVEIGADIDADDLRQIYALTAEYGVTVIRGQRLEDEQLHTFMASLGEPVVALKSDADLPVHRRCVVPISNVDEHGQLLPQNDWNVQQNRANELWHTDLTFQKPRASLSMLYARTIPPEGGDTDYCDTRLLWETMTADEQGRLAQLVCRHDGFTSRRRYGIRDWPQELLDSYPPVDRPLVTPHTFTRRHALTIGSYVDRVLGMPAEESERLLQELLERATAPAFVYSHRWAEDDLILWDNRATLHRATPFDLTRYPRDMRGARLFDPLNP